MIPSLSKFDPEAKLIGDTLVVSGDTSGPPNAQDVLVVLVSQGSHVAAGVLTGALAGRWTVTVNFGGFTSDAAIATGLIATPMTNVPSGDTPAPGGLSTFTWSDRIEIVQG